MYSKRFDEQIGCVYKYLKSVNTKFKNTNNFDTSLSIYGELLNCTQIGARDYQYMEMYSCHSNGF